MQDVQELKTHPIPDLTRGAIAQLKRREGDLDSGVQTTSRELRDIPARTMEEARLRRDVDSRSNLYATVKKSYDEATLAAVTTVPDVSVLDVPVAPEWPSHNRAPQVVLMAVLASIGVAAALALLLDRADARFRYADQATKELGLDVMGVVPAIKHIRVDQRDPQEATQVLEAFRSMRLHLAHAIDNANQKTIAVSSPAPGDGKSLVSENLALSFAEAGYRTVLVDADVRRGLLHERLAVNR